MRIQQISIYTYPLTVAKSTYSMSHGQIDSVESVLVKVTTDTGLVGWGETCPLGPVYQPAHAAGARAALEQLARGLLGVDPTKLGVFHQRMDALLTGHNYAKAALDLAAHDITGKHFGLRVADLIGGVVTERVPSYYAVSGHSVEEYVDRAEQRMHEGYPRLQIKVGALATVSEDIAAIRAIWEKVGHRVRLAVDGNRGLTSPDAMHLSQACKDIPLVIEQPCNTLDEILAIKDRLHHPVFLDESTENLSTVLSAVAKGQCDGFGMKVTRVGGIRPMSLVRDMCHIRSMPHTCDDAWGGDILAAACVHVAATVQPQLLEGAWIAEPYLDVHYDPHHPVEVVNGHIQLPTGPGLGVVPDEEIVGPPVVVID